MSFHQKACTGETCQECADYKHYEKADLDCGRKGCLICLEQRSLDEDNERSAGQCDPEVWVSCTNAAIRGFSMLEACRRHYGGEHMEWCPKVNPTWKPLIPLVPYCPTCVNEYENGLAEGSTFDELVWVGASKHRRINQQDLSEWGRGECG